MDLSENPNFGEKFYQEFSVALQKKDFNPEKLFFEGNKMQDDKCRILCDQLSYNPSLQILNLNNNKISDKSAKFLCLIIENCNNLLELHLSYNHIFCMGSSQIARSLKDTNGVLHTLDLSFNSICSVCGARPDRKKQNSKARAEAARAWSECFAKNQ